MNGIVNVLKPSNMTSHDVVSFMRRLLNIKKIGHTGTLDPNAAGVLPVCIGKGTRVAEYFNDSQVSKSYRGELALGKRTDTLDAYGQVLEVDKDIRLVETIDSALEHFRGVIEQRPPMYSAKKQDGKKLYELARAGIEVERPSRSIEIYSLDLLEQGDENTFLFDVDCSSGTYVRVLCEDIAGQMGTLGYMSFLLRTRVGNFKIEDAYTLEELVELKESDRIEEALLPLDSALTHYEKLYVADENFERLLDGIKLHVDLATYSKGMYRVYCRGEFIGMGRVDEELSILRMKKVLYQR